MRILVVEDSRSTRQALVETLEGMGNSAGDILEAGDGVEALECLEENAGKVDLVVTDWIMPNMTGIELLRRMKADPRHAKVPVIFITGVTQRDRVLEAVKEGARAVIVRPFKPEVLREKLEQVREEREGSGIHASPAAALRKALAHATKQHDANVPFFELLPPEISAAMRAQAKPKKFALGQTLAEFNEVVSQLIVLETGEVEILSATGGRAVEVLRPGDCVGEASFLSGDSAAMVAKARTVATVLVLDRMGFDMVLLEHPALGIYLTRQLARQAARDNARLWSKLADGLSGHLGMMAMGDLVQTLHAGQKTGFLRIAQPGEPGEMYFEDGELRHVRVGARTGEIAFFELLERTEGSFSFQAGTRDLPKEELRGTMALLLDGLRRLDEIRRRAPAAPVAGG